ncbi:MAG: methylamine utilization protein MauE [Myxococcales bacterium]|nr:methylamine utilization protein MauE [Myxococcales bacterium]
MIDPVIELTLRAILSLLFATAAWHKLSDRARFAASLEAYALLPAGLVSPISLLLPALECALAIGLVYAPSREPAAIASMALLTLYTGAIAANLWRGRRDIDCGCVASSARIPLSPWLVVRNLGLIGAAALLLAPMRIRALLWVDQLTVVTAVLVLCLLWGASQRLAQTGPALQRLGGRR